MIAVKENREYTISEENKESFIKEGYDIYDNNGSIIAYGAGKKISYQKYADLLEKYGELEEENAKLRKAIEASKEDAESKKKGRSKKGE